MYKNPFAPVNFEYFFAQRITFHSQRKATSLVIRLSVLSIALAVATMEISLSFVQGFETEIQNKVVGFGSHIIIGNYYQELDTEVVPLPMDDTSLIAVQAMPEVESVSPFVDRWSIFKSETGWDGVLLKGVTPDHNWDFFRSVIKEGEVPVFDPEKPSLDVLISRKMARGLELNLGDKGLLLFPDDPPRRRPVTVVGIYETGMEEFDNHLMICDIRLLQRIMRWEPNQASGFEVTLTSLDNIEELTYDIDDMTPYQFEAQPITFLYREIFDWLELQHQNVWVILVLMVMVGVINMTSVILILIIERTRTVGILKAMGLPNHRVQRLFIWYALFLILVGVLAGNVLGLGLLASQDILGWLRVSQEDYFIEVVPVAWVWGRFFVINAAVIFVCTLFMFIPSIIINRISPLQAIRFE